jgi:hypothetical protein
MENGVRTLRSGELEPILMAKAVLEVAALKAGPGNFPVLAVE